MVIKKTKKPGCVHFQIWILLCSEWGVSTLRTKILSDYYFFPLLYINILLESGNVLRYFCLKNSMDGGAWWATVRWDAKRRTGWSNRTHTALYCADLEGVKSRPLSWSGIAFIRPALQLLCSSCGSCSFSLCPKQVICWPPQFQPAEVYFPCQVHHGKA